MQILITFKRSEEWLCREIQRHSNKSGFVKDAVVEHLEKNKKVDPVLPESTKEGKV